MDKFSLTITLGNAAMQTPEDAADALRGVAAKLEAGRTTGNIMDVNGNTVGEFSFI